MDSIIGKTLAGYRVLDVLGRGGMGTVYKAEDEELGRIVALKMLDPALARDTSLLKRFRSEARALALLNDVNIVGVFALRDTEFGPCIVMEYVDGTTLADLVRERGALTFEEAAPLLAQFITAIQHAHDAGIIHRDIKPSNVMVTRAGVVKVADFGLAKLQEAGDATRTHGIAGTPFYMSPEQVKGLSNVDARSDLYSAGMTCYEVFTGRVPFDKGTSEFGVLKAIVEERFPPPSRFNPAVSAAVSKFVMRAIEKDPAKRYQTADEMCAALDACRHDGAASTRTALPRPAAAAGRPARREPSSDGRRDGRRVAIVGGGVAGVLALAGLAYALAGGPASPEAGEREGPAAAATPSVSALRTVDPATPGTLFSPPGPLPGLPPDAPEQAPATNPPAEPVRPGPAAPRSTPTRTPPTSTPSPPAVQPAPPLATPPSTPRPAATGTLSVNAGAGMRAEVDGREAGANTVLAAGAHRVRCVHGASGAAAETTVQVAAGGAERLSCVGEHAINVQVRDGDGEPTWATVLINGEPAGSAPLSRTRPPGTYRIAVRRDGYAAEGERVVTVAPAFQPSPNRVVFTIQKQ